MVSPSTPPAPASSSIKRSVDCPCQSNLPSRSPYSQMADRYRPSKERRKVVDGGCCLYCRHIYLPIELLRCGWRTKLPDDSEARLLHSSQTPGTNQSTLSGLP